VGVGKPLKGRCTHDVRRRVFQAPANKFLDEIVDWKRQVLKNKEPAHLVVIVGDVHNKATIVPTKLTRTAAGLCTEKESVSIMFELIFFYSTYQSTKHLFESGKSP